MQTFPSCSRHNPLRLFAITRILAPARCRARPPPRVSRQVTGFHTGGCSMLSSRRGSSSLRPMDCTSGLALHGSFRKCRHIERVKIVTLEHVRCCLNEKRLMAEGDLNPDRRRAQEEEYLRRRDQELIERQWRRAETEAERRLKRSRKYSRGCTRTSTRGKRLRIARPCVYPFSRTSTVRTHNERPFARLGLRRTFGRPSKCVRPPEAAGYRANVDASRRQEYRPSALVPLY